MKLSALRYAMVSRIAATDPDGPDPDIKAIHYRASDVKPGSLFVAVPGLKADGHDFIATAIENGAVAVVIQRNMSVSVPAIIVPDTRMALALVADIFYGHPSEQLILAGITGTNGKTTTAGLLAHILAAAGHPTGLISTIEYRYGGNVFPNPLTTPESADLQRILAEMRDNGITHVVMEVSSHAIDLSRIACCWMDVGIFTNLSQDHLDFHGSMAAYWRSKKTFFTEHLATGPKKSRAKSVILCKTESNGKPEYGRELYEYLASDKTMPTPISVGGNGCQVRGQWETSLSGTEISVIAPGGEFRVHSDLVGAYNAENILCATGAALALDIPIETIPAAIKTFKPVAGRMETIADTGGRFVFVDYAHTPDALENVLKTLRAITHGRLICVFGCGGDRDTAKRPLMGRIALETSDLAVITSDNPRTEPALQIIDDIINGLPPESARLNDDIVDLPKGPDVKGYLVIPDRRRAIRIAIRLSQAGDTVLVAGKGHETYQIIGTEKTRFDDRLEAAAALEAANA